MNNELKKNKKCIFFSTISLLMLVAIYVLTNDNILYDTNINSTGTLYPNISVINNTNEIII